MAGTNLYWGHGEDALRRARPRRCGIPVFLNGLARGCVPADHELFFSRARGDGLEGRRRRARHRRADGLPARLRAVVRRGDRAGGHRPRRAAARAPARGGGRALRRRSPATLDALRSEAGGRSATRRVGRARCARPRTRSARPSAPSSTTTARRCIRCASTASSARSSTATRSSSATAATSSPTRGASIDTYEPGCWLDPGPFGCLGSGPGYALAAKLAHPDRQVVLLRRRRRVRLQRDGVRHARPPRRRTSSA